MKFSPFMRLNRFQQFKISSWHWRENVRVKTFTANFANTRTSPVQLCLVFQRYCLRKKNNLTLFSGRKVFIVFCFVPGIACDLLLYYTFNKQRLWQRWLKIFGPCPAHPHLSLSLSLSPSLTFCPFVPWSFHPCYVNLIKVSGSGKTQRNQPKPIPLDSFPHFVPTICLILRH